MQDLTIQNNIPHDGSEAKNTKLFGHNEKDNSVEYFSERAKKLTTAIYLVSGLIPQTDPLRLSIRRFSIKLLSLIGVTPAGHSLSEVSSEVSVLCKKVLELLEIAFFSGYVSEMNFSVLKAEFDLFAHEIGGFAGGQENLSPDSLRIDATAFGLHTGTVAADTATKSASKSAPKSYSKLSSKDHDSSGLTVQKNLQNEFKNERNTLPSSSRNTSETKKISRKEAILSIIKLKGAVSIKDVSSVVINCSEKTIQRELTSLVSQGILKRTGERRWSTYSLT